ncbi:MAG: hypothetical protein AABX98_03015 [Nanoarchaeota archaeon]
MIPKPSNKAVQIVMTLSLIIFSLGFLLYYYEEVIADSEIFLIIVLGIVFVWATWQAGKIIYAVGKKKTIRENPFSAVLFSAIALIIFVILLYFIIEQTVLEPMYGIVNGEIIYGNVFDTINLANFFMLLIWICGSSVYFLAALFASGVLDSRTMKLKQLTKQQIGKIQLIVGIFLLFAIIIGTPLILFKTFYVSILWNGSFGITEKWGEIDDGEWTGSATQLDRAAHVQSFMVLLGTAYHSAIILFTLGAVILLILSIFFILQGYANMSSKL